MPRSARLWERHGPNRARVGGSRSAQRPSRLAPAPPRPRPAPHLDEGIDVVEAGQHRRRGGVPFSFLLRGQPPRPPSAPSGLWTPRHRAAFSLADGGRHLVPSATRRPEALARASRPSGPRAEKGQRVRVARQCQAFHLAPPRGVAGRAACGPPAAPCGPACDLLQLGLPASS